MEPLFFLRVFKSRYLVDNLHFILACKTALRDRLFLQTRNAQAPGAIGPQKIKWRALAGLVSLQQQGGAGRNTGNVSQKLGSGLSMAREGVEVASRITKIGPRSARQG
jgi:hypothetical protein